MIIQIIAQFFGIVGLACEVASYQSKKNNLFFIFQALAGLSFVINFLLIGAYAGMVINIIYIFRGIIFSDKNRVTKKVFPVIFSILLLIGTVSSLVISKADLLEICLSSFTLVAAVVGTFAMSTNNGKKIRYAQLFLISPSWLLYDCFNFTLGGILTEIFVVSSVIVSFVRFGKDGFEK